MEVGFGGGSSPAVLVAGWTGSAAVGRAGPGRIVPLVVAAGVAVTCATAAPAVGEVAGVALACAASVAVTTAVAVACS